MPEITVTVPVYNVGPYLRRCVDSILAQTFTDFELILVDDGSPDNCGAICDEYAARDERVRVIHQKNGGLSAARNAGIDWAFANSDSAWLAFVDSDDWVHPQYLEKLYRAAAESGVKLAVCAYIETETEVRHAPAENNWREYDWKDFFVQESINSIISVNKLYAKALFSGLRYPAGRLHEDEFLSPRLLQRAGQIAFVPSALYYYYQNPQGIMKSSFSLKRLDALDALEESFYFVKETSHGEVVGFCARRFLYFCRRYAGLLRDADQIPFEIRAKEGKKIERRARRFALRFGLRYAPPLKYGYLYECAFPKTHYAAKHTLKPLLQKLRIGKYRDGAD